MKNILIEACVESTASAIEAQKGGAGRVELCDNLYEGGTTPSVGSIKAALKYLDIGTSVMIRPRGGDFYYSDLEFEIMEQDIDVAKELGVYGIVFGILNTDGTVDMERSRAVVERAKPLSVTFHRAFDMTVDPFRALEDLKQLGVNRVLTSGQRASAIEGIELLKELVKAAGEDIIIMPGVDIDETNIQRLINETGAKEFHVLARKKVESAMTFRNYKAFMGSNPDLPEYETFLTDYKKISAISRGLF
ncbi:MAG: copper homeostasis protein CutC [bacterium]|nr:copper homeostasis protein CutC [bacterium]